MFKKILAALVFTLLAMQLNICAAMIEPDKIYLGGLTYGSKIDEMKNLHGEPDVIFDGVEGYETCEYADGAKLRIIKSADKLKALS